MGLDSSTNRRVEPSARVSNPGNTARAPSDAPLRAIRWCARGWDEADGGAAGGGSGGAGAASAGEESSCARTDPGRTVEASEQSPTAQTALRIDEIEHA